MSCSALTPGNVFDMCDKRRIGGVGVRWVFLEEDVAARAVDLCIEPALSCAIEVLKRLFECGQRGFRPAISRFRFR